MYWINFNLEDGLEVKRGESLAEVSEVLTRSFSSLDSISTHSLLFIQVHLSPGGKSLKRVKDICSPILDLLASILITSYEVAMRNETLRLTTRQCELADGY